MKNQQWLDYAAALNFPFISGANVTIYPESHELYIAGKSVHCSRTQFRFLIVLLSNICKTVGYQRLLNIKKRQPTARQLNLLKVHMFYLRRLLDKHRAQLEIRTVYGTGYQARPRP